jgi:receptor-binding and translocation channel-forming TcA subunit of Tc toxin
VPGAEESRLAVPAGVLALEKRDAEHLAFMRQEHEGGVLAMARLAREKQIDEAQAGLDALRTQRKGLVVKYQHFLGLLGAEAAPDPKEGVDIPALSARRKSAASGGAHLIDEETGELDSSHSARDWQVLVATTETLAGMLHFIPTFVIKTAPFCVGTQIEIGGGHIGPAMGAVARFQKSKGDQDAYDSAHFRRMAEHARREQQWVLEANLAAGEIMHVDKQIIALEIRVAIAQSELRTHDRQIENAAATEEFLPTKFTNKELFAWMQGQTSELFFRTYQLAYDLAKRRNARSISSSVSCPPTSFSLAPGIICERGCSAVSCWHCSFASSTVRGMSVTSESARSRGMSRCRRSTRRHSFASRRRARASSRCRRRCSISISPGTTLGRRRSCG